MKHYKTPLTLGILTFNALFASQVLAEKPHAIEAIESGKLEALSYYEDLDQDGVKDTVDQCPNSAPGATVNQYGCQSRKDDLDIKPTEATAPAVAPQPVEPVTYTLSNAIFDTNKHTIRTDQVHVLKENADYLRNLPANEYVLITGHADASGPDAFNMRLSWRRANSVKQFLAKELGISSDRFYIVGRGETQPIADNATVAGRQLNRRITLQPMTKDMIPADATTVMPAAMNRYK
ncbi:MULTISPECIES: OmpA family protein [Thiomicrorhabdus]|uniref:OmpA family protein n=1 Tax=Thiomicrorhabdus heinhorstiae TaxID=2748010 RepID=A0ABS0BWT8_9GAMM|nr:MULTISPECIES: OmpA family protein [Thiomicrorhabdus]MBF6057548.1 OmpA family protein [Thiomicrorhabdus heinhorstiae]